MSGSWTPGFHHPSEFHPSFLGGFWVDEDGTLLIVSIACLDEGRGHVSRFLDGLPAGRRVRVLSVGNPKLAGMLKRRGFKKENDGEDWSREADFSKS